jgi:hypothetical protein
MRAGSITAMPTRPQHGHVARSRQSRRGLVAAATAALIATVVLLADPAWAAGPKPVVLDKSSTCASVVNANSAEDCSPPSAVVYDGWSAWSSSDAPGPDVKLEVRSPAGVISTPAIAGRPSPFDVELGPTAGGKVVAVYSRCASTASDQGCAIYQLALGGGGTAHEVKLSVPGGGSLHEPAIWHDTLVFLRRGSGSEDVDSPTSPRPDSLVEWQIGSAHVTALSLPESRGVHDNKTATYWPEGFTGVVSGLSLGKAAAGGGGGPVDLAYVTSEESGEFGMSTLWDQRLGGAPSLVDQVTIGQGNVCTPTFLSPVISGGWLYAYLHDCPGGGGPISDDRYTRYSLDSSSVERTKYNFIHFIDDQIFSVVPDGSGVIWDNGEVQLLKGVTWKPIATGGPQTLCTSRDPFC